MALLAFWGWIKPQCATPIPEPSQKSGYYSDDFLLTLNAPAHGTIYYTTDGSIPSTASEIYQNGISITNRTPEDNRYASIRNVVTDWRNYTPDPAVRSKGTVIRAIYVNQFGFVSDIMTETYFVELPEPERGYTLSLVFDEEDLFGEDGIYVTGKEYDQWYLSGDTTQEPPIPNFQKKMEVPVVAQILYGSDELMCQPLSLRLQGNSARGMVDKRFILESTYEISETNLFNAELFPGTPTHSVMTKGAVPDAIIYELASDRSVALQKSVPVDVYLNGEFWYQVYFLERYDNRYFKHYFNVENVMLVKSGVVDEDVTENTDAYGELMYWVEHTDFTDPVQWEQLNKEVDIQSYIDFITINYYLCNLDFSDDKNHLMWRSVTSEDSEYADTTWRWCIYDIDPIPYARHHYPVENAAEVNIFSVPLPYCDVPVNQTVFFAALKNVPEFRKQFVLSFMDMVNNNFAPQSVAKVLHNHGLTLDWMDGFFEKRPAYAALHLADEFSLSGTVQPVTIHTKDAAMGTVTVNTSVIDLADGSWSGNYFTDFPITVTATANEGYRFLGWKGAADSSDAILTINVDGGIVLEALFARNEI